MTTVNVHEAKTHISRLLERVEAGEKIVIARNGKPIARLMPLPAAEPRKPGLLRGQLHVDEADLFAPLPEEELEEWES